MAKLAFGYNHGLPADVKTAWGCRMIVHQDGYTDLLWNRQGNFGDNVDALHAWLNDGPLADARDRARELLAAYVMRTREPGEFVLHEDRFGRIVGNTNGSAGYLYVAAWLFADDPGTAA